MSNESTIDTEILSKVTDNGIHDMFVLSNNVSNLEKSLDLLKSLCIKIEKYDNSYVLLDNNNNIKKTSNMWKINGYSEILKSITKIENLIKQLNSKIETLDPLISNIDTTKEDIEDYLNKIEDTLSAGIIEKSKNIVSDTFNNTYIDKADVINSIENNFTTNREITNNFNQELYNRLNNEIVNFTNNKGNK